MGRNRRVSLVRRWFAAAFMLLGLTVLPPALSARIWRSAAGTHAIEGSFVKVEGARVTIRRDSDGTQFIVELDKLSEADRRFIQEQQKRPPRPLAPPSDNKNPVRQPVPSKDARAQVEKVMEDIYGARIKDVGDADVQTALATELFGQANETKGNATQRFVLLMHANRAATAAGDVDLALRTVDEVSRHFEVEPLSAKAKSIDRILHGVNKQRIAPAVEAALQLMDDATAEDRFEVAEEIGHAAASAAPKAGDPTLVRRVVAANRAVSAATRAYQGVAQALAALKADPKSAAANLTVGRYRCLIKEDWNRGLANLAAGSDDAFKTAAVADLASPPNPEAQLAVGDQWWELATAAKGAEQSSLRRRAAVWYEKASPRLAGLDKLRVTKRMAEAGAAGEASEKSAVGGGKAERADKKAKEEKRLYALEFRGGACVHSNFLYDGTYPITLEAFVRAMGGPRSNQAVLGSFTGYGIALMYNNNGKWGFLVSGSSKQWSYSKELVENGRWVHLAGVFDGKSNTIFVNGQRQDSVQIEENHRPATMPLGVGGFPRAGAPTETFLGQVAGARVTKGALYTTDFKPPTRFTADKETIFAWNFREERGDIVRDESPHKLHGKIQGAFWVKLKAP